jgi:hypothetical protein
MLVTLSNGGESAREGLGAGLLREQRHRSLLGEGRTTERKQRQAQIGSTPLPNLAPSGL